ncbi:MAG: iron-sulfur cluster assembly accessory protein [SAR116 cluster bacterium]|nr:Fe-S cluster assembly scaffold SufA [Paracoccaceae bacterium]RCL79450.1 MAG: iron-sulfur cluster assembly accessory protein [SAR116 cluster bacterium]RPH14414.1 MAG: iron-sulfur cluster assembly accessory protein [Alphaproteobacteria bacterium TMED150]HBQ23490.1 Fe-S cluster assembly scaffold SufA [Alphaproteobacteria bacterium]HCJ61577.1 Fe-S cluster assembly scaffold SufA [Alphaproteobacteria bacterium]|tara:strand:+ start:59 stop:400 length:342 start_codon:yes stop_codon:yes gene_type:complete
MKDVVVLTDVAQQRIADILSNAQEGAAVRFSVAEGGCAGMKYKLTIEDDVKQSDQLVEVGSARIVIGPESLFYLLGCEIDYNESTFESGFVYNNPNVTDACGCGESISFAKQG